MRKLDSFTTVAVSLATMLLFVALFCAQILTLAVVLMAAAEFVARVNMTILEATAIVFGIECTVFLLTIPGAQNE